MSRNPAVDLCDAGGGRNMSLLNRNHRKVRESSSIAPRVAPVRDLRATRRPAASACSRAFPAHRDSGATNRSWTRSARRLSQECFEDVLVDVGGFADLHVPYILAIAFEEAPWVLERGTVQEAKLDVVRRGVHIRDGRLPLHPAAVPPLHRFLESGLHTLYKPAKGADDRAALWRLVIQVVVKAGVLFHLHWSPPDLTLEVESSIFTEPRNPPGGIVGFCTDVIQQKCVQLLVGWIYYLDSARRKGAPHNIGYKVNPDIRPGRQPHRGD